MVQRTLLRNGVVIVPASDGVARGINADVLIEEDRIARIAPGVVVGDGTKILDCTNKIVAPGFIDTHRHMYNTGLRGRHGNDVLADYIVKGKANLRLSEEPMCSHWL